MEVEGFNMRPKPKSTGNQVTKVGPSLLTREAGGVGSSRRSFMKAVGLLGADAALAACLPGGSSTAGPASAPRRGGGINVINFFTTEDDPVTQVAANKAIAAFEAAHPGTHVVMILMSNEERDQRVTAGLSAGQDLGVFEVATYQRDSYIDSGYLYPLDSIVNATGASQFAAGTRVVQNGHDWLFPYAIAPHVLWGRRDRVPTIPTTWQDFLAASKSSTGGGLYGAGFCTGTARAFDLTFPAFIWGQGGDYFDPQGNVVFGSDQARQGIQNYIDLLKYCPPDSSNWAVADVLKAYWSGRCAMGHFNGRMGDNMSKAAPQLEGITWASHVPTGPISVASSALSYLGVDAKGANPELAAEFVKFLLTGSFAVEYANSGPGVLAPVVSSVRDASLTDTSNPLITKHADWFKAIDKEIPISIDVGGPMGQMATGTYKPYDGPGCPWAGTAWNDNAIDMQMIQKIVLGGMSVGGAQAWAVDQYKGIVKDYKNQHPSWKPFSG